VTEAFETGRIDIKEIHEQAWLPEILRDQVTDGLQIILSIGDVYQPIAPRLAEAIHAAGTDRVVDLCSGGGGPWLWLVGLLQKDIPNLKVCLTDKFPNLTAFEKAKEESNGAIEYSAEPVDASDIGERLRGFRTVFSSFHHFDPEQASAILQNAVNARQGIGVFEAARRRPMGLLRTFLMPIGALFTAPFIRPFRVSRIFWTYLVPVIPFVLWFDGMLSCLRAYSVEELKRMVSRLDATGYTWEIGEEQGQLAPVTYLIGYPEK
jgi:hypothetical protein